MDSFTVSDGCTEGFNETDVQGYTKVSFVEREGLPNLGLAYHTSALSSELLSTNWTYPRWHESIKRLYAWVGISVYITLINRVNDHHASRP
jgi:hypothetical protein